MTGMGFSLARALGYLADATRGLGALRVACVAVALGGGCERVTKAAPNRGQPGVTSSASYESTGARRIQQHEPPITRPTVVAIDGGQPLGVTSTSAALDPNQVDVVFDQSMGELSSPLDWAFDGMSNLSALLRDHGATVSVNNHDLAEVLPAWGRKGVVLVLGIPWGKRYSADARNAIDSFLRAGGGVLVISEHDNAFGNADIQNELTTRYGTTTLPDHVYERKGASRDGREYWPMVDVAAWGIHQARLYLPAPLRVRSPARVLARVLNPETRGRDVVGSFVKVGRGSLIVVSDVEFLWNMTPDTGLRAHDNAAFALRVFGELAGRRAALMPGPEPAVPHALRSGERCVLFELAGQSFYPQAAPNGLLTLASAFRARGFRTELSGVPSETRKTCDVVALVAPLRPFDIPPGLLASRRLLIVGDGATNMLEVSPDPWARLPGVAYSEDPHARPLRSVLSGVGLKLEPITLLDEDDGMHPQATILPDGAAVHLHRSAVFTWSGWAYGPVVVPSARRATYDLIPFTTAYGPDASGAPLPLRHPATDFALRVASGTHSAVVARSAQVFAVADFELLSDQELNTPRGARLLKEILDWAGP